MLILLFRRSRIFFFGASTLWAVAVLLAKLALFPENENLLMDVLMPIGLVFCGIWFLYVLATIAASKEHRNAIALLSDDCDPEAFLALYGEIREKGKKLPRVRFLTESTYATGLCHAGDAAGALEIVRTLSESPDFAKQRILDQGEIYIDIGIYSLFLGDITAAREGAQRAEEVLGRMQIGTQDYNRLYREILRLRYRADVLEGNDEEAYEYFNGNGRDCKSNYARVNRMHTLAEIYRRRGESDQLYRCLAYMDRHGGTLKMAKDAREELKTLPVPGQEFAENDGEDE